MQITAAQSVASCALFKLPPELRNHIYEYAVAIDPDEDYEDFPGDVQITRDNGIPQPALLTTSKTIRKEAIRVFYTIQCVRLVMDSFDSTPAVLWKRKQISLSKQYDLEVDGPAWVERTGTREWVNLKIWVQRVHQGVVCDAAEELREAYRYGEAELIFGMLRMVEEKKDKPWSVVEDLLVHFKCALEGLHVEWFGY